MQVKDVIKMLQNSYPDQEEEIIVAYWDKVLIQEDKNKWIRLISAQLPIDEHRCLSSQKTPDKVF